ncbi:LOW QUALITY PROTEIN: serine protease inhibitor 42Dd [Drosophila obscura]|uniref:LOW QUALITY PROTEIN: serine protease inhibitor 42Dd n=1 Tax=Drosophila obscura TaxID=7282 RepID=UPI000BA18B38|nr:LOW QUALITY PROTEIN: serine protease inhibitor 42Dd [Drosophila obscura]
MNRWLTFLLLVGVLSVPGGRCNTIKERNLFATELFQTLATERQDENVIISPVSIQLALGLAYYGAEGRTATELQKTLHASAKESKDGLAESYHRLLHSYIKSKTVLEIANKVYTRENLKVAPHFREVAQKYFDSDVEALDFSRETEAVDRINAWVKQETQEKIERVVDSLEPDTNVALVNAIYFKARWARPFNDDDTRDRDFWLGERQSVQVPTMFADNWYYYADYPELDAKAIELFFENINMTMWFILPNQRTGLRALEEKLKGVDFKLLEDRWQWQSVSVYLPKFKFEFDTDLKPTLSKMGISAMFSDAADFSNIFEDSPIGTRITKVQHKTFIDVNEIGCEAAGASYAAGVPMSLPLDPKTFVADHPFVFIIRDQHAVYFTGHIVKF